jgi:hypothetical protein
MKVSGQLHVPVALPHRERAPGTHWIGAWVGPRTVLDAVAYRKIPSSRRESNPRKPIFQTVPVIITILNSIISCQVTRLRGYICQAKKMTLMYVKELHV